MSEKAGKARPRRRRTIFVLGGLVGLVLLALLLLPLFVDIENFREPIQQAVESATGWKAELGEMDLSIWSGMALTVSPARLASPDESSAVEIESIAIKASLLPLLSGRLEVRDVDLVGPELRLLRDNVEDGWILPLLPPPDEASADSGQADPAGGEAAGFEVAV